MKVKVKVFDENHEKDLEDSINQFLSTIDAEHVVDIKYQVSTLYDYKTQIYCFTAMVIYKVEEE